MAKAREQYAQIGYINVVESAADTLTFQGLSVFSNVLGQKAMLIHKAEYTFSSAEIALLAATGDGVSFGLSGTDSLTTIALNDPEVYDYNFIKVQGFGTPANTILFEVPYVKSWDDLPGGGLLVPADRLYGYVQGSNLGGAGGVTIRFYYSIFDMSAAEYLELAQSMRVLK